MAEEEKGGGGPGVLSGTVTLPGIGPAKKKTVALVGGIAAAFVLWRYWQARAAADEEVVVGDSDGDGFADGGTLPSVSGAVDPNNGYGLPEDDAGEGPTRDDYGFTGTTNAQWTQYAATQLTGSETWSYTGILTALGKYLNGRPLSATEVEIVQAAIAIAGYPPVGNHPVIPATGSPSVSLPAPSGLRASNLTKDSVLLDWNAVSGADRYIVRRGGTVIETSGDTQMGVRSLTPKTAYTFTVTARGLDGVEGPAASLGVTTLADTPTTPTTPKPSTPAKPTKPRYRVMTITKNGQTLSHLVAAYNKKYGTKHTVTSVWQYNLANRPASTVKTLKARGPNTVYRGSTFWFPY